MIQERSGARRAPLALLGSGLVTLALYACETNVIPHAGGNGPPDLSSGGRGGTGGKGASTGGKGSNTGGRGGSGGTEPGSGGTGADAGDAGGSGDAGAGATPGTGGAGASAGSGGTAGMGGMGKAGGAGKAGSGGAPGSVCGDNVEEGDEECDDGNVKNGDGCSSLCTEACELCEAEHCSELLDTGNELVTRMEACFDGFGPADVSAGGPAPNLPKSELCQRTVSCIRRSNCAVASPPDAVLLAECYCGSTPQDDCFSGAQPPSGPCVEEFEWAAESTTPAVILAQRIGSPIYALGRASLLAQCNAEFCTDECLGGRRLSGSGGMGGMSGSAGSGGSGAVSGAGGVAGTAGTGAGGVGAGGTAGGSGSGGQPAGCGDLVVGAGEECDPPAEDNLCDDDCESLVSDACYECETTVDLDGDELADCAAYAAPDAGCEAAALAGNASTAGGAPPNTPKRLLCYAVYECIRESGCSEGQTGVTGCYCGSTNPTDCFLGVTPPNGACKGIIEQGLESTAPSVIVGQRYGDPSYAAGMALLRGACDRVTCDLECNQ